jgi:hypothetical protein
MESSLTFHRLPIKAFIPLVGSGLFDFTAATAALLASLASGK